MTLTSAMASSGLRALRLVPLIVALLLAGESETGSLQAQDAELQQRQLLQLIRETQEAMASGNWLLATRQFDAAWAEVSVGEDPVLVLSNEGRRQLEPGQSEVLAGGRARLDDLFRTAPREFRAEYRRQFSQVAEQQLRDAVAALDWNSVRTFAQRYAFTPAAQDALNLLLQQAVNRGQWLESSLRSGQLLRAMEVSDDDAERHGIRLRHALLQWRAGLTEDAIDALDDLVADGTTGSIPIGAGSVTLPEPGSSVADWFVRVTGSGDASGDSDWLQPLGGYRRVSRQDHGPVTLQSHWSSNLFEVNDVLLGPELNLLLTDVPDRLQLLAARHLLDNRTVSPAAVPLSAGNRVIFRTVAGARSVDAATGELVWEIASPDSRLREYASMTRRSDNGRPAYQLDELKAGLASELLLQQTQSCTGGQIASDGKLLYLVEDVAAMNSGRLSGFGFGFGGTSGAGPSSYLRAYDLESGLLQWEAGGQRAVNLSPNILAGFYFLGAPLILGDRCYVLAENGDGIYLLQLRGPDRTSSRVLNPRIVHSQLLAIPRYKVGTHPVRRLAGLTPSFAQGLLICPTCDERIVAVSALDHSIRWVFRYGHNIVVPDLGGDFPVLAGSRDQFHSEMVDLETRWTDSLPRIVQGRVLITPRDANELLCLDLRTGAELWRRSRGFARSIAAVTDDRVILAGNKQVEAVRLSDGKPVWSGPVLDAQICGTCLCDGSVLQVPTSLPSIESIDVATGRHLLSQPVPDARMPGNLLSSDGRLYWQSLVAMTCVTSAESPQGTPAAIAAELLLAGDVDRASEVLDSAVASTNDPAAREMLISVLLESLRIDYNANSRNVARVRSLIDQTTSGSRDLVPLLEAMLGVTLNDAAMLPVRLDAINRADQRLDELFELVASALGRNDGDSPAELATTISDLLPVLNADQDRVSTSGFLSRRNSMLLASGIQRVLERRTQSEVAEIESLISGAAATQMKDSDPRRMLRFVRALQCAGLQRTAEAAVALLNDDARAAEGAIPAVTTQLRLNSLTHAIGVDAAIGTLQALAAEPVEDFLSDLSAVIDEDASRDGVDSSNAVLAFHCSDRDAVKTGLAALRQQSPPLLTTRSPLWTGRPNVQITEDRSVSPVRHDDIDMPQFAVPLFGDHSVCRYWSFVQNATDQAVVACDRDGRKRWSFDPQVVVSPMRTGRIQENYILASGPLLAMKLNESLYVVNAATATSERPPALLWQVSLASLNRDEESEIFRQFTPGSERIDQYSPSPAGHFPAGPLTPQGLPVLAGRRLIVFDPVTGDRKWQLDGLALDTVLLGNTSRVILISESSRQVESRDLVSGDLISVSGLPDWWTDAEINTGTSVRDVEVEPGSDVVWRASVFQDRCLLWRLTSEVSGLELRTPADDNVIWSRTLPQDSVCSNAVANTIAVLSNGTELRLFRTDTGTELCQLEVPSLAPARQIYLRRTGGQWLVMPESVEDPSLDIDLVMNSMHIHGHVCAIGADTLQLSWERRVDHGFIRQLVPGQVPIIPNAPILVCMSRFRKQGEFGFSSRMRALVIDTRNGDVVYDSGGPDQDDYTDLGRTLNNHGLFIDADRQRLIVGFETRDLIINYQSP